MNKCPACRNRRFYGHPLGYEVTPVSDEHPYGKVRRCDVCLGTGLATMANVMGYELSRLG
jgi:hypothetical protein